MGVAIVVVNVASCGGGPRTSAGGGGRPGPADAPGSGAPGGANGGVATPGVGGGGGSSTPPPSLTLDGAPIFTRLQRLTAAQWERAVVDILHLDADTRLAQGFAKPATSRGSGTVFTNNEKALFVDLPAELDFESGAEAAATLATGSVDALARLAAGNDAATFVRTFGRRAFRRPLTSDEEGRYRRLFALGEDLYGTGFANGAALVIRAMLQSPLFLYRSELGLSGHPLDEYEIASKLSFWLLGTTPSDALLDAAANGELDSAEGIERAALDMLEQPAAAAVMRDFHDQLYRLSALEAQNAATVPDALRTEMQAASHRFFDAIFVNREGLREILTSPRTFAGPELAATYGIAPAPVDIQEHTLGTPRIGYFLQAPFLSSHAADGAAGTIGRGVAVARDVLCQSLASHTAPVPVLPARAPGQTDRQRAEQATAGCAECHGDIINQLGFAFEGFDGLGRARTTDNGAPVDTRGSYRFTAGRREFAGAAELMGLLADEPQAHACYAKNLMSYALQRDLIETDRWHISEMAAISATQDRSRDRSIKAMIVALVRSPAFHLRAEGKP